MAKKRVAHPTLVMLVQQVEPEFWAHEGAVFADLLAAAHAAAAMPAGDDRVAARREAAAGIAGYVCDAWAADGRVLADCHAVLHADDERSVWSEAGGGYVDERKPLHIHMVARFSGRKGSAALDDLAALAGVEPQYIEIGRRGGAAVEVCGQRISQSHDNMLAYLVHAKYPEKAQYPAAQVATVLGGLDYERVYAERISAWKAARGHIKKRAAAQSLEELREAVLTGEVTKSQIMLTDDLFDVYARHSREIDDAISAYGQRRAYKAAEALRRRDFRTTVVYIWGASGHGKTHFAKRLLADVVRRAADRGERWQVYRGATANPLDDWAGEEIIFLDEARSSTMDAQDWPLLLDPDNASPARARYRNKAEVAPRLVVLTCTVEPTEFFYYTRQKGSIDEAMDQFLRRLASIVKVHRVDPDAPPRIEVSRVEKIDPYYRDFDSPGHRILDAAPTRLALTYGATETVDHSSSAGAHAVMRELAARSPDVDFANSKGWADADLDAGIERAEAAMFAEIEAQAGCDQAADAEADAVIDGTLVVYQPPQPPGISFDL